MNIRQGWRLEEDDFYKLRIIWTTTVRRSNMDEMDIQQIAEQRKESYDIKQMNKEFEASLLIPSHKVK